MIYYIHSDFTSFITLPRVQKKTKFYTDKNMITVSLNIMLQEIKKKFGKNFILPAYNYDFGQKKIYDVSKDQSQTGLFTEYCRKKNIFIRSHVPMFSSISMIKDLIKKDDRSVINPFDKDSEWEQLYNLRGKIVNFGVPFSPTYVHYIENKSKVAKYRYKKKFLGKIILPGGKVKKVTLVFYVRPKNLPIFYDMKKIRSDLKKKGILKSYREGKKFYYEITDARNFCDFVLNKMKKNNLYMLDKKTVYNIRNKKKIKGKFYDNI
tara:strand:+ start:3581 stop:4372 length:792 start_codon:yes stop_codon:yes gene_type:complete